MFRPINSREKERKQYNNVPRSMPSTMPYPIVKNHDLYSFDKGAIDRQAKLTREKSISNNRNIQFSVSQNQQRFLDRDAFHKKPVQNFQFNNNNINSNNNNLNYRLQNYHSFNNNCDTNKFYDRQPVNSRMDLYESQRVNDDDEFKKIQGGVFKTITSQQRPEQARKQKQTIKPKYLPRTRGTGIPKNAL